MSELTQKEIMNLLCAPTPVDEPEEEDFVDEDDIVDEAFIAKMTRG
jgi:hypothetical protein